MLLDERSSVTASIITVLDLSAFLGNGMKERQFCAFSYICVPPTLFFQTFLFLSKTYFTNRKICRFIRLVRLFKYLKHTCSNIYFNFKRMNISFKVTSSNSTNMNLLFNMLIEEN